MAIYIMTRFCKKVKYDGNMHYGKLFENNSHNSIPKLWLKKKNLWIKGPAGILRLYWAPEVLKVIT